MTAFWIALWTTLAGALWLIPGACSHVWTLIVWTLVSIGFDFIGRSEMKLFADFFGFLALAALTISAATKGRFYSGMNLCCCLALSQIVASATAYGASIGFAGLSLPLDAFYVLTKTYGSVLNGLFLASVLSLFIGVDVRERAFSALDRLRSLRLRGSDVPAPAKAHVRTNRLREHSS